MKKLILLLFFLLPTVAFGQTVIGTITILGASCAVTNACVVLPLGAAASSASITLTGSWTATVQFEASPDGGTTWVAINGTPPSSTTAVTSSTANGAWTFNVGSMTHLRARASALASGTVGVNINASAAPIFVSGGGAGGSTAFPVTVTGGVSGAVPCFTSTTTESAGTLLTANAVVLGGGAGVCPLTSANLNLSGAQLNIGAAGAQGILGLVGTTSGTFTITGPAVAGVSTNAATMSNVLALPAGSAAGAALSFNGELTSGLFRPSIFSVGVLANGTIVNKTALTGWTYGSGGVILFNSAADISGSGDTGVSRGVAGLIDIGTGAAQSTAGFIKTAHTVSLSADWTCGTGGTVSSCVAATIIGSTATPLTFTLPLISANWSFDCELTVGQATAATANQWNLLTATNGATATTANYIMGTAATAMAVGAVTDQSSTTTTFQIAPSWTLGGTATKMPVHIAGTLTGASASGTVFSLQLVAPTVADLVTIYQGSFCSLEP